ncbi:MAG: 16S rRNA (cytidine(1402)-2'-O)-methyltransferase [Acidobacteria bacterium]|nr:16S rRNA (cytidine(1402)-2'-O)-methyltransferase [Acidobacteriota bacterium]
MSGTLYLVATPIGNLEDITLRAIRILREVDLIAAEDTRHTAKLLRYHEIDTKTTSLHEHNEREKSPVLVAKLRNGESIALLSDAGTPVISDPGLVLVRQALDAGVQVVPLPGPSSVIAALVASGAPPSSFTFLGFPPSRSNDRKSWFSNLASEPRTLIFFESPHRMRTTLQLCLETWGDRQLSICREMTKLHEELVIRPISEHLKAMLTPRGEYTCVVWPSQGADRPDIPLPKRAVLLAEFGQITETSKSRKAAVKEMALRYGLTARELYLQLEAAKNSG